jgi:hypothetical protein
MRDAASLAQGSRLSGVRFGILSSSACFLSLALPRFWQLRPLSAAPEFESV